MQEDLQKYELYFKKKIILNVQQAKACINYFVIIHRRLTKALSQAWVHNFRSLWTLNNTIYSMTIQVYIHPLIVVSDAERTNK